MLEAIILILIGTFIGWAVPQPAWAKTISDKVTAFFKAK